MSTQPEAAASDQTRCPFTHWFLLLRCELPRGHRDNWHQGRDAANATIRYRRTIGVTEAYRDGEWQPTDVPTPDGLDWRATESVLNHASRRGDTDTITVIDGLTRQNDARLARVRELEAENQQLVAAVDQLTTVLEVVTAQHAKAVTARDKAKLRAKTSDDIASAEREVFQAAIRDLGGDPVQVQNLYAQLKSRTRQWREALADLDVRDAEITRLRAEIQAQGDALVRVRDQQAGFRADGMREAAAMLRRHCPNHGDADTCLISCHCPAADEIDRDANALAARTPTT